MITVGELFETALAHHQAGRLADAELLYRQILDIDPDNVSALHNLGLIVAPEEAVGLFERLVACCPDDISHSLRLALHLRDLGRIDEAITAFDRVVTHCPDDSHVRTELGKLVQFRLNQYVVSSEPISRLATTLHFRPFYADQFGLAPEPAVKEKIAIVIQGPLRHEFDFTVETVKLYQKLFPGVTVVVSTWEGEDAAAVQTMERFGAIVLMNAMPSYRGISNINLQIHSASSGIRWAKDNGFEYCLKTRTDVRIYNPAFFINALTFQAAFPLAHSYNQKKRLVSISNIVKYIPYAVPDMNMFGAIDDMILYWSPPHDLREELHGAHGTLTDFATHRPAEAWLLTQYLDAIGRDVKGTLRDFWDVLRDHFVVMDASPSDLYWRKYDVNVEYRWKQYQVSTNFETLGFAEWLRLYTNRYPMNDDPRISGRRGHAIINDILMEPFEALAKLRYQGDFLPLSAEF